MTVAAGTVWQLWNWNEKRRGTANVVIIDEGGQMNVGTAALAIRWLDDNGRLIGIHSFSILTIVAGDHLQLAPILKGTYPKSDYALFGSILHCLLRDTSMLNPTEEPVSSPSEIFFQLEENFRMNPQLCNFVELIYQKRFQPMQSRREIANLGLCITEHLSTSLLFTYLRLSRGNGTSHADRKISVNASSVIRRAFKSRNSDNIISSEIDPQIGSFLTLRITCTVGVEDCCTACAGIGWRIYRRDYICCHTSQSTKKFGDK